LQAAQYRRRIAVRLERRAYDFPVVHPSTYPGGSTARTAEQFIARRGRRGVSDALASLHRGCSCQPGIFSTNPWPTPARIGLIVAGEAVITRRLKLTSQFQSWTHYAHYAP
jgi:hypothetical protein